MRMMAKQPRLVSNDFGIEKTTRQQLEAINIATIENIADNLNDYGRQGEEAGTQNWEGINLKLALNLEPNLTPNTSSHQDQGNFSKDEVVYDGPDIRTSQPKRIK